MDSLTSTQLTSLTGSRKAVALCDSQTQRGKINLKVIVLITLICVGVFAVRHIMKSSDTLKVGFPFTWGNLTPSLQHTAYADTLIKNQFESLVRARGGGKVDPLAAKSWTISPDFRVFTFIVDTERRFSDGTPLEASHFKQAWEHALSLQPKSANSSLQDLLYKVEGYEEFAKTGKIPGLIVHDARTFEVRFKGPFRMALERFSGGRFGVYRVKDGKYLGTGSYVIEELAENSLLLTANPFAKEPPSFKKIEVSLIDPKMAEKVLLEGIVDLYASADSAEIRGCDNGQDSIQCLMGDEVAHSSLDVNGLPGRFFSNPKYRRALQALIVEGLPSIEKPRRLALNGFRLDPQIYLPIQAGRLSEEEVMHIVESGSHDVDDFIEATKKTPLYYVSRNETDWIKKFLESRGVRFTENSGQRDFKTLLQMIYKTSEPDLLLMGQSVANGDPDGIYHALGKNGAILAPMIYRERVGKLLEDGRGITDLSKIDDHYRKVSRAALEDVPFVHIGFDVDVLAYRKDRVRVADKLRDRKDFHFSIFEPTS